jgi:hypothetical protein
MLGCAARRGATIDVAGLAVCDDAKCVVTATTAPPVSAPLSAKDASCNAIPAPKMPAFAPTLAVDVATATLAAIAW